MRGRPQGRPLADWLALHSGGAFGLRSTTGNCPNFFFGQFDELGRHFDLLFHHIFPSDSRFRQGDQDLHT